MNSSEIYKREFEKLLQAEEQGMLLYKYHIDRIKDAALLEKLQAIYEDEKRHVAIVKGFLNLIKER